MAGSYHVRFFYAKGGRADAGVGVFAVISYGNDLPAVSGGADAIRRGPLIARGGYDDHPDVPQFVYFFDKIGLLAESFAVSASDRNIYDIDAEARPVFDDPVDAEYNVRNHSLAVPVENFYGYNICLRRNAAEHASAEHAASGGDAGDVRSVTVVVIRIVFSVYCVVPSADSVAKVRVAGDSAVQNGNTAAPAAYPAGMAWIYIYDFPNAVHVCLNSGKALPLVVILMICPEGRFVNRK